MHFKEAPQGFLTTRDLSASVSFKSVNMQNKHGNKENKDLLSQIYLVSIGGIS